MEQDLPELTKGAVLVKVAASLVSPGTEVGGWHAFAQQKKKPVPKKEQPFGYSNSGVVIRTAEVSPNLKSGDRVACIGAGYALHTDYAVVPHNFCVPLPENVTFEQGAYGMLFATAMQTLRRGQPEFGEYTCVVGLGILSGSSRRAFTNFWELRHRLGYQSGAGWLGQKWGIDAIVEDENGSSRDKRFTGGDGLDAAVLAMAGTCDETVERLVNCMKLTPDGHAMGRIMIVGWPEFKFGSSGLIGGMNNIDIRRCSRTGAGYHDLEWEHGSDYPPVFMRWTTKTNLKFCMRLISERKVNVDSLTTHRIKLNDVEHGINKASCRPGFYAGSDI